MDKGEITRVVLGLKHKHMTDKEVYRNVERLHRLYPDLVMHPDEYMKMKNAD